MRGLSPEQLLLIADAVCEVHGVAVRDFAGISAAAAVSTASFHGVRVHASPAAVAAAVAGTIRSLEPLSGRNETFAAVSQRVLLQLNS